MSTTPKKPAAVPIHAFFAAGTLAPNPERPELRPALMRADVIIGVDVMSEREFLVYGRQVLRAVRRARKPRELIVMRIAIDQETDELEMLTAMVELLRGRHDYRAGGD